MKPYKQLDTLERDWYKSSIIKWLCEVFGYLDYPHTFADKWISWRIDNSRLSVSFDLRQPEQAKLLSLIHPRFLGIPQNSTLKIVNEKTFYLELDRLFILTYPSIIKKTIINKTKHIDDDGDIFYVYDWELILDDNTTILYRNQSNILNIDENHFIYQSIINERKFINFLEKYKTTSKNEQAS